MSNVNYIPIACSFYDVLEASAVTDALVRIELAGNSGIRDVRILDLFSRDKAEFMRANDATTNEEFTVRLDQIDLITEVASGKRYSARSC
jgi:transcriptional antiterminator Rof (Rho-off)